MGNLDLISHHHLQPARRTVFWLAFALRPMRLSELCEVAIFGKDQRDVEKAVRLLRKEALVELCGSLIRYNRVTTTVALAHPSVFDFLRLQD